MMTALARIAPRLPTTRRTTGKTITDDQVVREIGAIRRGRPSISRTRALRELRESGIACEQSRFASIWERDVGRNR